MMKAILSSMRVEQWYKNFIIFVGIVFSLNITNLWMLARTVAAFAVFCILSSGVYIINDIHDAERDRLHPVKKDRSIPSGKIKINDARVLAVFFITVSLISASRLGILFCTICFVYLLQNVVYTFWLKSLVIVDVVVVSIGFVWRAIAGTVVIGVPASPWLIICSFLLALFLALIKRESEITAMLNKEAHRASLTQYSKPLLETFLNITITSLLVAYMIYTFESKHVYLMATIPFAFIGVFRHLQLVRDKTDYYNPTFIFRDRMTQVNILIWVLISIAALYDLPIRLLKFLTSGAV